MSSRTASFAKTKNITMTGLFAAVIFVLTAYLHIPTGAGYTHAGDGMVYLAACILPTPYAMIAAAVGGGLSDIMSGYSVWLPATVVIKAAMAAMFSSKGERIISARNIAVLLPSAILSLCGYSLYEGIVMAKGFSKSAIIAAFTQSPSYIAQGIAGGLLFISVAMLLDRVDFKKRVRR